MTGNRTSCVQYPVKLSRRQAPRPLRPESQVVALACASTSASAAGPRTRGSDHCHPRTAGSVTRRTTPQARPRTPRPAQLVQAAKERFDVDDERLAEPARGPVKLVAIGTIGGLAGTRDQDRPLVAIDPPDFVNAEFQIGRPLEIAIVDARRRAQGFDGEVVVDDGLPPMAARRRAKDQDNGLELGLGRQDDDTGTRHQDLRPGFKQVAQERGESRGSHLMRHAG
jgi:hypothetical protein